MAPDPARFAALLCDSCLEVKPGQQVSVRSTTHAAPLLLALEEALLEREAWPLVRPSLPGAWNRPCPDDKPDLGLVNSILRGAGGRLEARGSTSDGTTLTLTLPRAATSNYPAQVRLQ